jgi:hypothetical protein
MTMSAGGFDPDKSLNDAMATLEAERRKLGELGKLWEEGRTTVRAKDQAFSMTFDGHGELIELVFNTSKYRTLAPAQLASSLVETLQRGRAQSMEKVNEVMGRREVHGVDFANLAQGKADPLKMLDDLIAPMLEGLDGIGGASVLGRPSPKQSEERGNG